MLKKNSVFLIGALVAATPLSCDAALVLYGDRSTFLSAYSGFVTEDFQSVTTIEQVLSSTNIVPGLTLSLTSGTNAYLAPAGQSSNPTQAIGVNLPIDAGWQMSFANTATAVGFDVFQNMGGGSQSGSTRTAVVDVFGASGLLGSFNTNVPSGSGGFFGVFSDAAAITSVVVNDVGSYDVIDNVSFSETAISAVPEPSGILALGFLLGGGLMMRTRGKTA